jgi:hypothetical protein
MGQAQVRESAIPRWLRWVLIADRAGSSWYIGAGFFFAPVLAVLSPWPRLTAALWMLIALAGLWLGLLGVAMAIGLAMVLRAGGEIPEDDWRSILDHSKLDHRVQRTPSIRRLTHGVTAKTANPTTTASAPVIPK